MTHTLDDITPAERARLGDREAQAIVDEWNANEAARPLREWQERMRETDVAVPRTLEDIADAIVALGGSLPKVTADKVAAKKALRQQRPS